MTGNKKTNLHRVKENQFPVQPDAGAADMRNTGRLEDIYVKEIFKLCG